MSVGNAVSMRSPTALGGAAGGAALGPTAASLADQKRMYGATSAEMGNGTQAMGGHRALEPAVIDAGMPVMLGMHSAMKSYRARPYLHVELNTMEGSHTQQLALLVRRSLLSTEHVDTCVFQMIRMPVLASIIASLSCLGIYPLSKTLGGMAWI